MSASVTAGDHRLPAEVRALARSIVRERYADFGPMLAAEKLAELHGCSVSRATSPGCNMLARVVSLGVILASRLMRLGTRSWM